MPCPNYSIIVPAYNAEASLPACLDALKAQTVAADQFEIIVVDDGSTDRTRTIAEAHAVIVLSQSNKGPAAARNLGAAEARGSILLFTDADCRPAQDWLAAMVRPIEAGADGAQGIYRTDQTGLIPRFVQAEFEDRYRRMRRDATIDLIATYSAAYDAKVFRDAGGFDESYTQASNEDTELSYRLVESGRRLVLVDDAVVRHTHPESVLRYMLVKFRRAAWRMKVYRNFPDKMLRDRYTTWPVKVQTLAALTGFVSFGLGALWPLARGAGIISLLVVVLSALPGAFRAWKKDREVGLFFPLGVACRALALGSGAVMGIFRN
jgi:glycosyltransferase involved in cell wall biosynthesis